MFIGYVVFIIRALNKPSVSSKMAVAVHCSWNFEWQYTRKAVHLTLNLSILKLIKYLMRLTVTMLCRRVAGTGDDEERSGVHKKFKDQTLEELLDQDRCQTLVEFGKILQVDKSTVS